MLDIAVSNRKQYRLMDAFKTQYKNLWNEWDNLEPEQRKFFEDRYEKNITSQAMSRLRKKLG